MLKRIEYFEKTSAFSFSKTNRLLVDTPEKYEHLKNGVFDAKYRFIDITATATPDIFLQPQHFSNASFLGLHFISGPNKISIFPGVKYASALIYFRDGENPLSGVPHNYYAYKLLYTHPAKPTTENIDNILLWKNAEEITVHDESDVSVSLISRVDEFKELEMLRRLSLAIRNDTYERVNVGTLVSYLWFLDEVNFLANRMTDEQIKEFHARNDVSAENWNSWIIIQVIYFQKVW